MGRGGRCGCASRHRGDRGSGSNGERSGSAVRCPYWPDAGRIEPASSGLSPPATLPWPVKRRRCDAKLGRVDALFRLGTPEAMTALLQACLSIDPETMLAAGLCAMPARLAQEQDGPGEPRCWPWVGETGGLESAGRAAFERMDEGDRRVIGECLRVAEGDCRDH